MVGGVRDVITCAEFQIEIFMGYNFTGGRILDFPMILAWALQQCSTNALPVILKLFFTNVYCQQSVLAMPF